MAAAGAADPDWKKWHAEYDVPGVLLHHPRAAELDAAPAAFSLGVRLFDFIGYRHVRSRYGG